MAISCPKCGRQYDVTLFQFGRTVNCACGERVGYEHKINLPLNNEIKIFADVNVARLVRWLRAIGLDTIWEDAIPDGELVRRAIEEKRFVLTLDKRLLQEWRADNILLLSGKNSFEHFRQVIKHFRINKPQEFFTRCLICNHLLRAATAEEITAQVPAAAKLSNRDFYYCTNCRKVYWQGSHTERMRATIEDIFNS